MKERKGFKLCFRTRGKQQQERVQLESNATIAESKWRNTRARCKTHHNNGQLTSKLTRSLTASDFRYSRKIIKERIQCINKNKKEKNAMQTTSAADHGCLKQTKKYILQSFSTWTCLYLCVLHLGLPCWNVLRLCGFFLDCYRPACIYTMKVWVELQSAGCTLIERKDIKRYSVYLFLIPLKMSWLM